MPRYEVYSDEKPVRNSGFERNSRNCHECECPECRERRLCREHRDCDKKRCDDDRWECPDKSWGPPCPDWCKCPPWFWCKPEHDDDDKKCDKRDEKKGCGCDRKDGHNKRKECCGELEAYGYVYSLTATAVTILTNNDVVFTNNGPLDDVTHTPNTSQVFIRKSGVYQIYYGVNTTLGVGATISLAVNGAVNPSTTIPIAAAAAETSGKVLLNLRAGDFLTLRNSSAVSITLAVAPAVGAQLTLERIDEIENCNF